MAPLKSQGNALIERPCISDTEIPDTHIGDSGIYLQLYISD